MLKEAVIWKRNYAIYQDVLDLCEAGEKRDFAYSTVARSYGVSRSVVVKAFTRMKSYLPGC